MAVLSHQPFLPQSFSVQLVLLFSHSSSCRCCTGHVFQGCSLLLQQSQGLLVALFVPKQSSVAAVLWQISAAWKRGKDAGSWVYLSDLKKTCLFSTVSGTELIWCSGVLLLPGIVFLGTVWKLQGDFCQGIYAFEVARGKLAFVLWWWKLSKTDIKVWFTVFGVENASCSAMFLVLLFFFLPWVKPALFPFSWDCNSWIQNCIFHKCVILTATSIQDTPGCLFSWVPDIVMQNKHYIIFYREYQTKSRISFSITQKILEEAAQQQCCSFVLSPACASPALQPGVNAAFAITGSDFLRSGSAL